MHPVWTTYHCEPLGRYPELVRYLDTADRRTGQFAVPGRGPRPGI